jgi:malonate decarboxylase epsilon subunit
MLHSLPDHPEVTRTLAEASTVLGRNVQELDAEGVLDSTVSTQLSLYTAGVAITRALAAEGALPDAAAGLSIGAYAAASAVGALDFADGLRLVRLRSTTMEEAFPSGFGLVAVVGLDEEQIAELVQAASTPRDRVFVGNINAPRQIVVAGADAGLTRLIDLAQRAGCTKAERLMVRIPSHCALLEDVASRLVDAIRDLPVGPVSGHYVTNRRARATRVLERIREDVATNIAHPVRWHDSTQVLVEMGTQLFVEIAPGRVLSNLATEAFPQVPAIAMAALPFEAVVRQIRDCQSNRT